MLAPTDDLATPGQGPRPDFSVVLLTGESPSTVQSLASRIAAEVPGGRVTGVLYGVAPPKRLPQRMRAALRNLRSPGFLPYVAGRVTGSAQRALGAAGHHVLRLLHAAPPDPNGPEGPSLADLREWLGRQGAGFHFSPDMHAPDALEFVRALRPDLGIVFGTGILKPALFEIPRFGSINIHKRKVPDYRGGGAVGLWELLDGASEIGVTVHRVAVKLDAGDIVRAATIPIEPFDTLESLRLKADVVGEDLLVQATADYASDGARPIVQQGSGRMFKTPSAHQLRRYRRQIQQMRPPHRHPPARPLWKLLLRVPALGPRAVLRNRARRRQGAFPVVILFHHVITDRPHSLGMSTAQFHKQLSFLRRHYRIVSLDDALRMLREGRVDAPTVVLTFDDGYAENYINVRAVTDPLAVPVTFFVATDHVATGRPFDHDGRAGNVGFQPLSWEQARVLRRRGHGFGSHTRTHFDCGSTDEDRLRREITDSRAELESELGEAVPWFSFPWGYPEQMSELAVAIGRESYTCVFSACGGVNPPDAAGVRWHLRRCAQPNNIFELELLLQSLLELDPPGNHLPF